VGRRRGPPTPIHRGRGWSRDGRSLGWWSVWAVVTLSLVGCSASPPAAPAPGTPDRAAFAEALTAANDAYSVDLELVQEQGATAVQRDPKDIHTVFAALEETVARARERYGDLQPPPDAAGAHEDLLANLSRQILVLGRLAASAKAGEADPAAAQELASLLTDFAARQQLLAERLARDQ
jgi:hypothetical protein